MRLDDRHELVVGVDRLRRLAGADGDRRERRDEAPVIEDRFDDGQHVRVHRHPLEGRAVHQQVVDANGLRALEVVGRRHDPEVDLQAVELFDELVDQVGLDGVLDDRVALLCDRGDVVGDVRRGHGPRHVRQGTPS